MKATPCSDESDVLVALKAQKRRLVVKRASIGNLKGKEATPCSEESDALVALKAQRRRLVVMKAMHWLP